MSGDEAWNKIENLRDQRTRMKKRITDSKKSGAGTDDVLKPTMWWYDLLSFLDTVTTTKRTIDNLNVSAPNLFAPTVITNILLFSSHVRQI